MVLQNYVYKIIPHEQRRYKSRHLFPIGRPCTLSKRESSNNNTDNHLSQSNILFIEFIPSWLIKKNCIVNTSSKIKSHIWYNWIIKFILCFNWRIKGDVTVSFIFRLKSIKVLSNKIVYSSIELVLPWQENIPRKFGG